MNLIHGGYHCAQGQVKEKIDEILKVGKITKGASMGADSHPPRSGLVQRIGFNLNASGKRFGDGSRGGTHSG